VNKNVNIKRQLIAAGLLVVFLFITLTKIIHSHETNFTSESSSHVEQVVKSSHCSICDYHFTKDTDFQSTTFVLQKVEASCVSPVFYQSRITSSIGLSYSDRGPPARA
jgi:hypothetical protein